MNDKVASFKDVKKNKALFYSVIQVLGIFAILLIGGCFDWLNLKFKFDQFLDWNYWNGVIQQVLMYSIALALGYIGRLQKEELTNKEYELMMNLYHQYFIQITNSFSSFINNTINPRIKKEFYKDHIESKLYKLEKKTIKKDEWKLEYEKALDWLIADSSRKMQQYEVSDYIVKNQKQCKKYILKRYSLEILIDESNIDKACKSFNKYPRINPRAFTWGIRTRKSNDKKHSYQIENNASGDIAIKFVQKVLWVLLSSIVIGSIVFDPNRNELLEQANGVWKLFIKYFMRVCSTAWSYVVGLYMGKEVFEDNYIDVVSNRNSILEEYIDWKKKSNEDESFSSKIKQAALMANIIVEEVKQEEEKIVVDLSQEEKDNIIRQELARREAQRLVDAATGK